tara:strand:- start:30 stop:143 length:114 start_codon:yes stop_codon:yes gene_type:complete
MGKTGRIVLIPREICSAADSGCLGVGITGKEKAPGAS